MLLLKRNVLLVLGVIALGCLLGSVVESKSVDRMKRLAYLDQQLFGEQYAVEKSKRDTHAQMNGVPSPVLLEQRGNPQYRDDGRKSLFGWKMAAGVFFVLVIGLPCCCLAGISVIVAICFRQACGW